MDQNKLSISSVIGKKQFDGWNYSNSPYYKIDVKYFEIIEGYF